MKTVKTRSHISTSGSFVAVPSAFKSAGDGLKNVIKLEFKTVFAGQSKEALNLETVFSPDRFLVDLGAAMPASIDPKKIINDCELVKKIATANPKQLTRLVEIFQDDLPDIDEAFKITREIGLTEEASIKAGGGLLGLIVVLIAVVAASGCATTKKHKKPDKKPTE